MTEQTQTQTQTDPDYNPYDADNFVATSPLGGRRGVILDGEIIKHNYGGATTTLATALQLTVSIPEFERPSNPRYSAGGALPSLDGRTAAERGPHVVGKISKGTNLADFLTNLKAAGFPLGKLKDGFGGLAGADVTFKTVEKKINKKDIKSYDFVGEFHGFVTPEKLAELKSAAESVTVPVEGAPAEAPPIAPPADDDLKAAVASAIVTALRAEASGEIVRGQLSQKVGPSLSTHPNRARALALLINDGFLATIQGVTYDKRSLKLSA